MNMPVNLPNINTAKLPESYEKAKTALATCSKIDECQEWANKAEALASYAKQAGDETLRKHADRIQARAIRRCGELLKQIPPDKGGRPPETKVGANPSFTRTQAARDAELSEHQKKQALRVANIESEEFEKQVESDDPPTITNLADQGKKSLINLGDTKPKDFVSATQALAQLRRFAEFAAKNDPVKVASGVTKAEISTARQHISAIDTWLDKFVTSLGD